MIRKLERGSRANTQPPPNSPPLPPPPTTPGNMKHIFGWLKCRIYTIERCRLKQNFQYTLVLS